MASSVDAEWYFEGSGVPVGWKDGAVAFKDVPSVVALAWPFVGVATGAIVDQRASVGLCYCCCLIGMISLVKGSGATGRTENVDVGVLCHIACGVKVFCPC